MTYSTVAELLADPSRWTQRHAARMKCGKPVGARDARACCWCLLGAIEAIYDGQASQDAQCKVENEVGGRLLSVWNDDPGRTHSEVVELCRRDGI
mgnify:CR=1 FL=1